MPDFVIVGGGIIGMLTARELRKAGSVTLIERGHTGREASWAGGGILSPLYPWRYRDAVNRLAIWGHHHYPQAAEQLHQESGIDPEYRHCGLLLLDIDDQAAAAAWAQRYQMDMHALQGTELRQTEPALHPRMEQGWWLPDIGQMRNPRLVKAARGSIIAAGVNLIEDREVTGLLDDGERISGVTTQAGNISAGQVIIAGGSWTAQLLSDLQPTLPITPVKGQMILFKAPPGLVGPMILQHDHYLIPRRDGRVVAGSTLEQAGYDKTPTKAAQQQLSAAASALVPELANYPIEHHWAGLRPSSPGGIPFIGPHPQRRGLYINSGHFRNGIITGLASARLLADQILDREPILDPAPYALDAARPTGLY